MTPDRSLMLHVLRHALLGARDRGRVIVEFSDGPGPDALQPEFARRLADVMLALVNLPTLGPHWRAIDRERAREVLALVLHEDLEQEVARVPRKIAYTLADRVLAAFEGLPRQDPSEPGPQILFFTNVKSTADLSQSPHKWASGRLSSELDAGVAIIAADLIGLVWVEDRP
jgi:hypothetical protein